MFENMSEDKLKKTVTGIAIAGTILFVLLFAVMLYQFISMGVKGARIADLQTQVQEYEQKKGELEEKLEIYETDKYLENEARKEGYIFPEDSVYQD